MAQPRLGLEKKTRQAKPGPFLFRVLGFDFRVKWYGLYRVSGFRVRLSGLRFGGEGGILEVWRSRGVGFGVEGLRVSSLGRKVFGVLRV